VLNWAFLRFFMGSHGQHGPQSTKSAPLCRVGGYAERTTGAIGISAAASS